MTKSESEISFCALLKHPEVIRALYVEFVDDDTGTIGWAQMLCELTRHAKKKRDK